LENKWKMKRRKSDVRLATRHISPGIDLAYRRRPCRLDLNSKRVDGFSATKSEKVLELLATTPDWTIFLEN